MNVLRGTRKHLIFRADFILFYYKRIAYCNLSKYLSY